MQATAVKNDCAYARKQLADIEKAFQDCGIGGPFSRFDLKQDGNQFMLFPRGNRDTTKFSIRVLPYFDKNGPVIQTNNHNAMSFGTRNDSWLPYLNTTQKVMAKIVRKFVGYRPNDYYVDPKKGSLIVVNHGYALEIAPGFHRK